MSKTPINLSRTERRLLEALQHDATRSQSELARESGMSRSSVARRIRDFEALGLIERQVTLLDPALAGFTIEAQLAVAMIEHTEENRLSFERHVGRLDVVTECFSVSGERDYILHVVVPDMAAYTDFLHTRILAHPTVRSASSTFVLKRVKYTTRLPLGAYGA